MPKPRKTLKHLKIITVLLMLAVVFAAVFAIYIMSHTSLKVIGHSEAVWPAAEFQDGLPFSSLQTYMANGAVPGILYKEDPLTDDAQFRFIVYTLRLLNDNLLQAETVECRIEPSQDDILMYTSGEEVIIPPGQTRDVRLVLLTKQDSGIVRQMRISCYFLGYKGGTTYTYAP